MDTDFVLFHLSRMLTFTLQVGGVWITAPSFLDNKVNIVMIDATRPVQHDRMLPAGNLRDLPEQLHRAHYFNTV